MGELYPVKGLLERTTPEFRAKLVSIASELNVDPTDLAAVMSFETGGTFSPSIRNKSSGATGLIQWMPATARAYGTTTEELAAMSAEEQLDWVKRYFQAYANAHLTCHQLYLVVFFGGPLPEATVLGTEGAEGFPGAVYRQNRGLDLNDDGQITAGEASTQVRWLASNARRKPPIRDDPKATTGEASPSLPSSQSGGRSGVVRKGEGPWQVAARYTGHGDRWPELYATNPGVNVRKLRPGQRLILPDTW